ncbi:TRAM domain-containing protein [Halobellus inordinatus]|uniref:TRAM domain-containing protein n=1 Tax=Halobellus inordinatus TaxID=1126236 RepID=UPI002114F8E0|nr:TRAM domain-containing protein [Halobellus ramosii]
MVEISDSLNTVYSAHIEEQDEKYVVSVPASEIERGDLSPEQTYRVALLTTPTIGSSGETSQNSGTPDGKTSTQSKPPVTENEIRTVSVESIGDQGDGIAKVEHGYVVIIPGAQPGEEVTVKIDQVRDNVSFASVVDDDARTL